jgi:hypothetical protein
MGPVADVSGHTPLKGIPVRRALIVVALVALGSLAPASAHAAAVTCEGLQQALGSATSGTTVTLAAGQFCTGHYQPAEVDITIEGELDSTGHAAAGFEPSADQGDPDRSMFVDSHSATTTIRNLIFRGPSDQQIDSGGLFVNGNGGTLILSNLTFTGIRQTNRGGGLLVQLAGDVTVTGSTFSGNDAGTSGGGAFIDARSATVQDSFFTGNDAGQHGGGLALLPKAQADLQGERATPDGIDALVERNTFTGNHAGVEPDVVVQPPARSVPPSSVDQNQSRGGGLLVAKSGDTAEANNNASARLGETGGNPPVVELNDNTYDGNVIDATRTNRTGGGVEIFGVDASFIGDEIINNDVLGDANNDRASCCLNGGEGGGLAVNGGVRGATLHMINSSVAGNTVGFAGYGAGVYTGCIECGTSVTMEQVTIAGNAAGAAGGGAGIGGDQGDTLNLINSIVFGNTRGGTADGNDVAGFSSFTAVFSDVCNVPQPGSGRADVFGNVCVDPLLADAQDGDVHQTAASPTIDAAEVPAETGVDDDYEGDPRPILVSSRSGTPDDMGADEYMSADIKVTLEGTPNPALSGDKVTLTGTVTNSGPSPAKHVMATFSLGGMALVSSATTRGSCTGTVTCVIGDLASGQTAVVTIVATAPTVSGRASTTVTASATISSPTSDPSTGDHTASKSITVNSKPVAATPTATPAPASGALPAAAAKKCGSRRFFTITVRLRKDRVVKATITVNGKKAKVRKSNGRLKTTVDLKFLPKSTITVRIKATTKSGKKLSGKRVYHPCSPKREGSVPEL